MTLANIIGGLFLLVGAITILANYYYLLQSIFLNRSNSFLLLAGSFFACVGVLTTDIPNFYFWIPLVLDFTIPMIIYVSFMKDD